MSVAHPILAVFGLLAVAIPIILHLLRRRKKPVSWGAMRFILEAQRRTRRRFTIDELLLLLARCLLVALAGLAIARPMLAGAGALGGARPTTLAIVIDNSLTSGVAAGDETELQQHIARAIELLGTLDAANGDRASLVLAASPPEALIGEPTSDLDSVRRELERLTPVSSRADLAAATRLATDTLPPAESDRLMLAIFSGWRAGSVDLASTPAPSGVERVLAPLPSRDDAPNVTARGVVPLRRVTVPGDPGAGAVRVRLGRSASTSSLEVGVTLSLVAPGALPVELASGVVRFEPGLDVASSTIPISLPDEPRAGSAIRLSLPDDGLAGDNVSLWPIDSRERLRVGIVADAAAERAGTIAEYDAAAWFSLALAPDPETGASIDTRRIASRSVSTPLLSGLDAVFVAAPGSVDQPGWESLGEFAAGGGLLVVVPDAGDQPQLWPDRLSLAMGLPWTVSRVANNLDEPGTISLGPAPGFLSPVAEEFTALLGTVSLSRFLEIETGGTGLSPLVTGTGEPFLVLARPDLDGALGLVAVWAAPPELSWTDLPAKPVMIPLVQELLREGIADAGSEPVRLAGQALRVPAGVVEVEAVDPGVTAPEGVARVAGLYRLLGSGGQPRGVLAVNADPLAGRTEVTDRETIQAWLAGIAPPESLRWTNATAEEQPAREDAGTPIAAQLLVLALVMAIVEVFFAWRVSSSVKTGRLTPAGGRA